jgi:hypothetical protein
MKKQIIVKWRALFVFSLSLFILSTAAQMPFASARQDERILVDGNPPLKKSDVDELIKFFEWLFEVSFDGEQRAEFQRLAVKEWKTGEKAVKGMTDIIVGHRKFSQVAEAQRERIRQELLPQIVASFKTEQSEVNVFLSQIYQNGAGDSASQTGEHTIESGGSATLADLVGTWSTSGVAGERYKNSITGELSDAGGTMIEYIISPNGNIKYTGYLSNTIYSCTTKLFVTKTGKVSVSGSKITFNYSSGERDYQNTCNSSSNHSKKIPAEKVTRPFAIERDEYGLKLCMIEENGSKFCIRKSK